MILATPLSGCAADGASEESLPEAGGAASAGATSAPGAAGKSWTSGGTTAGSSTFVTTGGFGQAPDQPGTAGASTAGASTGGAVGAGGSTPSGVYTGDRVGNVSAVPMGSFSIAGGLYFLGRDAGGLFAMSMQCTHKFCALVMAAESLDCPCHKSRFARDGKVLQGPATEPLPHYKVTVDGAGDISVDKYTIVSASTRTPVSVGA